MSGVTYVTIKFIVAGVECELDFPRNTTVHEAMWAARGATFHTRDNGDRGWAATTESGVWCFESDAIAKYANDMPIHVSLKAGVGA